MELYISDRALTDDEGVALDITKVVWASETELHATTSTGDTITLAGIRDTSKIRYDGTVDYATPPKTVDELSDELMMTQALLGDTILSNWETQSKVDSTEQVLGDTILSNWEMDSRISEIEALITGGKK